MGYYKKKLLLGLRSLFEENHLHKIFVNDGMFFFETNEGETIPVVSESDSFTRTDLEDELSYAYDSENIRLLSLLRDCEVVDFDIDDEKKALEVEPTTEFWVIAMRRLDKDELHALGADDADSYCRIIAEGDKMTLVYGDIERWTYSLPITDKENSDFWRRKMEAMGKLTHIARKLRDGDSEYSVYDFVNHRYEYTMASIRYVDSKWRIYDAESDQYFAGCPRGLKAEYNDKDVCATAIGQCLLYCKNCPKK
jgi:hypothetical protein